MGILNNIRYTLARGIAPKPRKAAVPYGTGMSAGYRVYQANRIPELRTDAYGLAMAAEADVWADGCIQLRSKAVARMPWNVYSRKGDKTALTDSAWHRALRYARIQYDQNLFYVWEQSLSVHGEAYIEQITQPAPESIRGVLGVDTLPGGLRLLNAIGMDVDVIAGQLARYLYTANGFQTIYQPSQLFVNRYNSKVDDFRGASPMIKALNGVGIKRNMAKYMQGFYANDATPGGTVSVKDGLTLTTDQQKELMNMWAAALRGADNAYSWIFLPAEVKAERYDNKPPEHQDTLDESQRREICAAFGVPMSMVNAGGVSDPLGAGSTMDSQRAMFYESFVIPECDDFAQMINDRILPWLSPYEPLYFEFDYSEIQSLIHDTKERSDKIGAEFDGGRITFNEMRQAMGKDPVEGGDWYKFQQGVVIVQAAEMARAAQLVAPPPMPAPTLPTAPEMPQLPAVVPDVTKDVQPPPGAKDAILLLHIGAQPDLVHLQNQTKNYLTDTPCKWNEPDNFHLTLVYLPVITDEQLSALQTALEGVEVPEDLSLRIGSLNRFEEVGSYPVYFRIAGNNTPLLDFQQMLYDLCEQIGIQCSGYSDPAQYKPHVTMGYASVKPKPFTLNSKVSVKPLEFQLKQGDTIIYSKACTKPLETASKAEIEPTVERHEDTYYKAIVRYADSPLDELGKWQRKVENKGIKAAFQNYLIRNELADTLRTALSAAGDDSTAIRAAFDATRTQLEIKAIQATRLDFENNFDDLLKAGMADEVARRKFTAGLKQLIRTYGFKAYVDGLADGGVDGDPDEAEQEIIAEMVREQSVYISGLGDAIFNEQSVTDNQAAGKAAMWYSKSIQPFYNAGLVSANGNQMLEFTGDDGEESCDECVKLKGQRHRAKDWKRKQLWPVQDGHSFTCGGWQCKHALTPVSGKAVGNWLGSATKSEDIPEAA